MCVYVYTHTHTFNSKVLAIAVWPKAVRSVLEVSQFLGAGAKDTCPPFCTSCAAHRL